MSNVIVRITRPNLTPEERSKRMDEVKAAAKQLLIAAAKAKQERGGDD